MFFLDVEPDELLKRLLKRNEHEMFENLNDLVKVRGKSHGISKRLAYNQYRRFN